ncbi:MAG: phosphatase PAP2 family protein [Lachnospiraceae bacterium]|nr:phosphatase PAP2 family protein [Lachnospiraceae bacterium]
MKERKERRTLVDYRGLRLTNLTDKKYSHLLLILGWVFYFTMYFITEHLIPVEKCHVIHSRLDDIIPFREEFVLVYVFWYLYVFGTLLFYLLFDRECFRRVQTFIISCQIIGVVTIIVFPSVQNLRPESFDHHNFFTWILDIIYNFDTPTGVFPSMHVAFSMAVAYTWCRDKYASLGFKIFTVVAAIAIAASTTLVKQHSALDVIAAVPVGLVSALVVWLFEKRK